MKMFKFLVMTSVFFLFSYIASASVPANLNAIPEETSYLDYERCFELGVSEQIYHTDESAYSVGDCYIGIAEELMTYFDRNDTSSSPYRNRIITALQYADSWLGLAERSNEVGAENRRNEIRAYIVDFEISDQNVF